MYFNVHLMGQINWFEFEFEFETTLTALGSGQGFANVKT